MPHEGPAGLFGLKLPIIRLQIEAAYIHDTYVCAANKVGRKCRLALIKVIMEYRQPRFGDG